MPESRKRPGHPYHQQAAVPAKQRVKGGVMWAILLGVFGLLIALFAAGTNYTVLAVATVVSAVVGYVVGKRWKKKLEREGENTGIF